MKKILQIILLSLTATIAITLPALAAGIVPECTNTICTLCDGWHLASNIMNFLLVDMAIPVLVIMFIWGGVLWVSAGASSKNIEQGKNIITSALIGVLIAFAGWLIVDTIIKSLASGGQVIGAWQDFPTCKLAEPVNAPLPSGENGMVTTGRSPSEGGENTTGNYTTADQDAAKTKEQAIRDRLFIASSGDIQINHTACNPYDGRQSGCTNIGGLNEATIQEMIDIQQKTKATIVISGGSELDSHACTPGRPAHCTGNKFDIRLGNTALDNYITTNFQYTGTRSGDGALTYTKPGTAIRYYKEGDHWDVLVP